MRSNGVYLASAPTVISDMQALKSTTYFQDMLVAIINSAQLGRSCEIQLANSEQPDPEPNS